MIVLTSQFTLVEAQLLISRKGPVIIPILCGEVFDYENSDSNLARKCPSPLYPRDEFDLVQQSRLVGLDVHPGMHCNNSKSWPSRRCFFSFFGDGRKGI